MEYFETSFVECDNQHYQRRMGCPGWALLLNIPTTSILPDTLFQIKKFVSPTIPFDSKTTQAFLLIIRAYSRLKKNLPIPHNSQDFEVVRSTLAKDFIHQMYWKPCQLFCSSCNLTILSIFKVLQPVNKLIDKLIMS